MTFSNGDTCSYQAGPDLKPKHIPPPFPVAAPYEAAMAALKGSAETVLDYMHTHFLDPEREEAAWYTPSVGKDKDPFAGQFMDLDLATRQVKRKDLAKQKAAAWAREAKGFKGMLERMGDQASPALLKEIKVEMDRANAKAKICKDWQKAYQASIRKWFDTRQQELESALSAMALGTPVRFEWDGAKLYITLNGRIFTSGAETVALATTFITAAPRAARYNLVMLPDRLVDDDTTRAVLSMFASKEHVNVFMPRLEHLDEGDEVILFERDQSS